MMSILSRTVAFGLTAVLILLVAAGIGGASITGSRATPVDGGATSAAAHELVTAGGAPRYVPTVSAVTAWQPQPGITGLAELRWGEGGRPVLVPVDGVR